MRLFYDMKSNLYNIFIPKCVSSTNLSIEHHMEGLINNNKQKIKTKIKHTLNDCIE